MKMKRNLIILAVVLVLAVGLVVVAPKLKPSGGVSPTATASEGAASIALTSYTTDKVSEITMENASGTYTLYKKGDKYVLKGHENETLDQTNATGIYTELATVMGERIVKENPTDLATYGLDKPTGKATVKYTDGKTVVFLVGATAPSGSRYVMMQGDPRLVTVAAGIGDTVQRSADSLLAKETVPVTSGDDIDSVVVKKNGEVTLQLQQDKVSKVSIYAWQMIKPWQHTADAQQIPTFMDAVVAIALNDVVEGNAQDLAKYGLDKPARECVVTGKGKTFDLLIGKDSDEYNSYAMVAGSTKVYTIPKSQYTFMDTSAESLTDKMIMLVDIKHCVTMAFHGFGQTGTLSVKQVPLLDDKGVQKKDSNGQPQFDQTFKLEGKDVKADVARYYYQDAIGISAHSLLAPSWTTTAASVATLTFTRDIDPKTITVEFLPYDKDFYAVRIDGNLLFKIEQEKVKKIGTDLGQFLAGKLVVPENG